MKILIVDDNEDFLKILGKNIELWGHEVIPALSGAQALVMARKVKADVIILDYLMPGMNGIDTLKELRKMGENVPVIMFTASPDKCSMEEAEKLGILAYVPKVGAFTDSESSLKAVLGMAEKRRGK